MPPFLFRSQGKAPARRLKAPDPGPVAVRGLVVAFLVLLASTAAPSALADHPGSNKGLAGLVPDPSVLADGPLEESLVHRLPTVDATFARWNAQYPELVERSTIGKTSSGFDLLNVRVTDESIPFETPLLATGEKLRVYLDGGHHGNEYLGVELVMYYLEGLLAQAKAGDEATLRFLGETEIYATPIINVDGNYADSRKNSRQVDPNRNYDFHWGEDAGSSGSIASGTYRGPSAFSESETRANADFQTKIRPDMVVTMHTGIAEFYWPWGWTHEPSPDDALFTSLEKPFEDATNGRVDAMQGAELYIVTGASDDWAYAILGAPGFTFEVHEDQFIPVYGQPINTVIKDQLAGLEFIVKNVKRIGAWLEPTVADGALTVVNEGWGVAANVTLRAGDREERIADIPRDGSVTLQGWPSDTEVVYDVLLIESTKTRTARPAMAIDAAGAGGVDVPAPGIVAVLALLGLVAVARRRSL